MRTRRIRRTEGPGIDTAVLLGALALAFLPLVPVYGTPDLARTVLGGLVLGAIVALATARLGWSPLATAAATLGVYLLAGPALAVPATTLGGVVPTLRSLTLLLGGTVTVWKQVLTLDPLLGATGAVLVAPLLLALVGSVAALGIALRSDRGGRAALAALVPLGVLLVSLLLGTKTTVVPVAASLALTGGLLVWAARRAGTLAARRLVALSLLGAVALGSGAVVGPVVAEQHPRLVVRDELVPPFDPRDQASPLSSYRRFVKEWATTDLLTVQGLPEGARVRIATMDAYDGVVWNVAGAEAAEGSGRFRRVGETILTPVEGDVAEVTFAARSWPFVWLPTVGYARRIAFGGADADAASALRYNDATGTAVLVSGVPAGARWTAEVVVPVQPDLEDLDGVAVADVALPEPQAVPDAVAAFARDVAGTATSPALVAESLQEGLAQRGWFSHGLTDLGDHPSPSGHGADRITALLTGDLMVGDSEQYASAMALMAREMGLPARVVLGFVPPGDAVDLDGQADGAGSAGGAPAGEAAPRGDLTFTGDDVRAWVEVDFAGVGWVTFDPTPDESRTAREDTPQNPAEPEPQVRQPPPPPLEPVTPPEDDTEEARTEDSGDEDRAEPEPSLVGPVALAVGVPLVLVLGPPLLLGALKARRRRRRRRAPDPVDAVVGGWDEMLDVARDLRRPLPPAATRREIAVALAGSFPSPDADRSADQAGRRVAPVGGPLAGLAEGADAIVFGPDPALPSQVTAYWRQVDVAVRAMRSGVPRRTRWRARWSTASMRRRGVWRGTQADR